MVDSLTAFQQAVLTAITRIPRGKVSTYQEVAKAIGKPAAVRAVGNALHVNPSAPAVPCHRVVTSSGKLGGYAFGTTAKIRLLEKEGVTVTNNQIDLQIFLYRL